MIRKFNNNDIESVMTIWLESNADSHDFINPEYWKNNYNSVRSMIPQAEVYISETNSMITGFIGLTGNYIAGIFISRPYRSKGIGTSLLNFVKEHRDRLILSVYEKNKKAVKFYKESGFIIKSKQTDSDTMQTEYIMHWKR
ncbi:MAG: GNAT family N-acetyltransferase [Ruminococcus sp.]|nr:GNAT family N-acetyltransferase [Ruminococcus sp.]